ncbi:MAG: aldo/keto reductase [Bryobacteraceae bacterium]|nr:aldo/keto reductase [Bryobacteraceae bacterium]
MQRRSFLYTSASLALAQVAQSAPQAKSTEQGVKEQWKNRQPGMAYRRFGRSGMMISEVVSGGDPIRSPNYQHLGLALEMGMNYFDMAPAYGRGDCEIAYGKFLGTDSAKRDKVFLATKVSGLQDIRNRLYKGIFDGLPEEKKSAILKRVDDMKRERMVDKPGYFVDYYPGQRNQIAPAYLANAMMQDYANKVEGSKQYREFIITSIEGSLKRIGADSFDVLHCPHGACTTEELDIPEIYETFAELRKQGKVRFLGVTTHTDPAAILRKATALGFYDVVQGAYNIVNAGYMDQALQEAHAKGVGFIGMKVAMAVATHHKALQPVPQWRIDKINRIVPGDMKPPLKAYMWALQNPNVSAVVSNLWDETHVRENLGCAGKKLELQPA